ncbi:unnamed protein product [Leuciscus chuanchicus]
MCDPSTDSYNLARYRVQKALETSHVEDSDENSVRKIIPPRRYREEEIQPRRAQQTQHFQEDSGSSQEIYKLFENLERRIIQKLDEIQENITSAVRMQNLRQPITSYL